MSESLAYYQQQANAQCSTIPWLSHIQKTALADFERLGFPQRSDEDWKYTTVDSFLQHRFVTTAACQRSAHEGMMRDVMARSTEVPVGYPMALVNGHVVSPDDATQHWPLGVVIQPLAQAWLEHAEKIKPYLNEIVQHQHGFQALNTAMLNTGLLIYLPEGVSLTTPIRLSHWQDKDHQASYVRHLVICEAGSSATLIEDYQGAEGCCYFTNTITEVSLATHAKLSHYKIQRESQSAYHVGQVAVRQSAGSQFESHSLSMGGQWVRSDVDIDLCESQARCFMNGIYQLTDQQHLDHHTCVRHQAPFCQSEQDYKGILNGRSRAVFNGRVVVEKEAQHTEAKQQNKNILLSANTEIDTKPQLEIFTDDVTCTHGATVGQLDEDALFYLATRGIDRAEATQYLLQAFTVDNLRAIKDKALSEWISRWIGVTL
jgi:Fe-S cluster assembly protein SufD